MSKIYVHLNTELGTIKLHCNDKIERQKLTELRDKIVGIKT